MTPVDVGHMRRALELAERGRGAVEPNPLVGAVVADGPALVAEGFHARFGGPHAEVEALMLAGAAARGKTLYVTLEPCCHHGKTPPCTERVIASGVRRVVVAMTDPFPNVAGEGIRILRAAGIEVDVGCLEDEALGLNAAYLKLLAAGRPYVHAKWAMTLDGRIAAVGGSSKWISGEASRADAHELRGRMDGILIGVGTALADDPLLTARPPGPRTPVRVVLDSTCKLPPSSKLVQTASEVEVLLATTDRAPRDRRSALEEAGCSCLVLDADERGGVSIPALLDEFGRRRWTHLLVEGGSGVLGSFLAAGEIDAVRAYVAPLIVGGSAAKGPVGDPGIADLEEALRLGPLSARDLDGDVLLTCSRPPRRPPAPAVRWEAEEPR